MPTHDVEREEDGQDSEAVRIILMNAVISEINKMQFLHGTVYIFIHFMFFFFNRTKYQLQTHAVFLFYPETFSTSLTYSR